jgi:ABC-2 type transport system permease protein
VNLLRIRELVRKEFIELFRDKKNRPLLIIAPLVQILVFGYVLNFDIRNIRVAVLDKASTVESREFIDTFKGSGYFKMVAYPSSDAELGSLILNKKADLGISIAPDMSDMIKKGQTSDVQVLVDGSTSNMAFIRISYTMTVIDEYNRMMMKRLYPMDMKYGEIDASIRQWYNPNINSRNFFVPGIVAFLIMLLSLILTSIAVIREKEAGTMEQIIVTPVKPAEFIMGKTIPYIIISLIQMVVILLFAKYWFSVPMAGSALLLFAATLLFLLSTLGVGLFISTVSSTQQQAMMTTFFVVLPFFMLSGFVFPIDNMPQFVQWLTYLNPLRYFLVIIRGVFLKGVGFSVLWEQFAALAILGAILFTGATLRFRKTLD